MDDPPMKLRREARKWAEELKPFTGEEDVSYYSCETMSCWTSKVGHHVISYNQKIIDTFVFMAELVPRCLAHGPTEGELSRASSLLYLC
ncbi:hypothetical protein V6N13_043815 [Hibiscus sabdariffa]|uniref:Uncharacterized protein n=1 Tax=Hibiscus sabdariffa TaxID=183260 RepID=A0ABR2RGB9_9ROSI